MRFAPKPENDFAQFIRTYYDECRARFDKIEGIAGKWMFRDLIPGMSDFDTRFIVSDDMTVDDWCVMSDAVGEAHLSLCQCYPSWSRNLEHLPGINLTWSELVDERCYYPEYKQWAFYHSEKPQKISNARQILNLRPWDIKDKYFHLKKFCLYYGRYNRTIDPAINLGVHENKYSLHSRIMHYFAPPAHSAMILLKQHNISGKFEALEIANKMFPELKCWDIIWEILHGNYETSKWYEEPYLTELENLLEEALKAFAVRLFDISSIIPKTAGLDISKWKEALKEFPIDPVMVIFDKAKFSRLMKGRLKFYANAPAHFDFTWLIQNELGRMENNLFKVPFSTFWKLKTGKYIEDPETILDELKDILTAREIDATKTFTKLLSSNWENGKERETASAVAEVFDDFFKALNKVSKAARIMSV